MSALAPLGLLDLPEDYLFELFDYVRSTGYVWLRGFFCVNSVASLYKFRYVKLSVPGLKSITRRRLGDQYEAIASFMARFGYKPFLNRVPFGYFGSTSSLALFLLFPSYVNHSVLFAPDGNLFTCVLRSILRTFSTSECINFLISASDVNMDEAMFHKVFSEVQAGSDGSTSALDALMVAFVCWSFTRESIPVTNVFSYWRYYVYFHFVYFLMDPAYVVSLPAVPTNPGSCRAEGSFYGVGANSVDGFVVNSVATKFFLEGESGLVPVHLGIVMRSKREMGSTAFIFGPDISFPDDSLFRGSIPIPHVPIDNIEERNSEALMSLLWPQ